MSTCNCILCVLGRHGPQSVPIPEGTYIADLSPEAAGIVKEMMSNINYLQAKLKAREEEVDILKKQIERTSKEGELSEYQKLKAENENARGHVKNLKASLVKMAEENQWLKGRHMFFAGFLNNPIEVKL